MVERGEIMDSMTVIAELLGKLGASGGFDELSKFILAHAPEHLAPKYRLPRQLGHGVREGMLPGKVGVTIASHQQKPGFYQLSGQKLQQ